MLSTGPKSWHLKEILAGEGHTFLGSPVDRNEIQPIQNSEREGGGTEAPNFYFILDLEVPQL